MRQPMGLCCEERGAQGVLCAVSLPGCKLSQERLAALLGYDKTYVSMIETGRRNISDVATRRHIARTLGLPMHTLGVTGNDDADFAAMIQFGDSTIRLAEIARQSGRRQVCVRDATSTRSAAAAKRSRW